jgi:hypothetical protein
LETEFILAKRNRNNVRSNVLKKETGDSLKLDYGKLPWHLLPWDAVAEVVKVLQFGASKYRDRGWEEGMEYSRLFSAGQRHGIEWFQKRKRTATDSKLHHLAHKACNDLFLLAYELRKIGKDDRPETKKRRSNSSAGTQPAKKLNTAKRR